MTTTETTTETTENERTENMTTTTTTTEAAKAYGFDLEAIPEVHRSKVAALIPAPGWVDGYVSRQVEGGPRTDYEMYGLGLQNKMNIILRGPSGAAKTSSATAFAASAGLPCAKIMVNGGADPATVWGGPNRGGDWEWVPSAALLVVMYGGVLIFDEINMAHPRILAAFYSLLDINRSFSLDTDNGRMVKAAPGLVMVATYNPAYEGTANLNFALINRFAWPVRWDYDRQVEDVLIPSAALVDFAWRVRDLEDIRTDTGTNLLVEYCETVDIMGSEFAKAMLLNHYPDHERAGVARALEMVEADILAELTETTTTDTTERG